jgi:hypothetical protein
MKTSKHFFGHILKDKHEVDWLLAPIPSIKLDVNQQEGTSASSE